MKNILFINACVRPKSRTHLLATQIISQMEGTVEEVNLEKVEIAPLNAASIQKRDMYIQKKDFTAPMFQFAKQFAMADEIVIGAPYWDLSFPSTIRVYFEAITVNGLSFGYTSEGCPKGLCKAKKIIYVTTAGGSIAELNLGFDYVKALAKNFYGIPEILCFKAENLDVKGADVEKIMEKAIDEIRDSRELFNQ